jgi:exopolyphosphatase / guanosine-5'-triphosphate,3'-diphosphate pyrophosphatase
MRAAVIDIGSNSIKVLVADRGADGVPVEVHARTLETRISQGLGLAHPRLSEDGMARGVEAITTLFAEAKQHGATTLVAVATSAVRDAANGADFRTRVEAATGIEIRILTGDEEANFIGAGLTTDPALQAFQDFFVVDLGGGSLECLAFRGRKVAFALSLPLGCVRLTERFVPAPGEPLVQADAVKIVGHVRAELEGALVPRGVAAGSPVVGTGGTLTTVRAMRAAREGRPFAAVPAEISVGLLNQTLSEVGPLDLAARKQVPSLAGSRADVFPAALVTLLAVASWGGFGSYHHSLRNLRWGVAAKLLAGPGA